MPSPPGSGARWSAAFSLALAAALVAAPAWVHFDDTDSQLYQVVVRHMVEDGSWFELRYLPGVYPRFREHLPFGFWPYAAAVRLFGEGALPFVAGAFTLGAMGVAALLARRLFGGWAAPVAVLVLGTTESFFLFGAFPLLDPPLLFFSMASAALLLDSEVPLRSWVLATLCAALAVLVKGPFGGVALLAAGLSRAALARSVRQMVAPVVSGLMASLPLWLFLLIDRRGEATWWKGYLEDQLLASASAARADGTGALYPFANVAGRFWPGLPLVAVAVLRLIGWPARIRAIGAERLSLARVALAAFLTLLALCIPLRHLWTHVLVAYPLLAVLAGGGARPLLDRLEVSGLRGRVAVGLLGLTATVAWLLAAMGYGRLLTYPPCPSHRELKEQLGELRPGERIWVVAPTPGWGELAYLSAERGLEAWPCERLGQAGVPPARMAMVREGLVPEGPSPWRVVGRARGWVLLRLDDS